MAIVWVSANFVVADTVADIDNNWPDGALIYCVETKQLSTKIAAQNIVISDHKLALETAEKVEKAAK